MADVKLIRMHSGEDVLAAIVKDDGISITIVNAVVHGGINSRGKIGMAPWVPILSKTDKEITIDKKFVVFVAAADDTVVSQYISMFGEVMIPSQKLLI